MDSKEIKSNKKQSGFTLIELMVVVAIISILSAIIVTNVNTSRYKARDANRISDMHQIRIALELFFDKYGRYPGGLDGVSQNGEYIGDDNGPIEQALRPYISAVPKDPAHDGTIYFYSYDPVHCVTSGQNGVTLGFNKAEAKANIRDDTNNCVGDMNQHNADYVEVMYPSSP